MRRFLGTTATTYILLLSITYVVATLIEPYGWKPEKWLTATIGIISLTGVIVLLARKHTTNKTTENQKIIYAKPIIVDEIEIELK